MKVFIWHNINKCSNNYHSDGGVVVFARTERLARKLANAVQGCDIQDNEHPIDVRRVDDVDIKEHVYIFPNAGCC